MRSLRPLDVEAFAQALACRGLTPAEYLVLATLFARCDLSANVLHDWATHAADWDDLVADAPLALTRAVGALVASERQGEDAIVNGRCYPCGAAPPLRLWRCPDDPQLRYTLCPSCWVDLAEAYGHAPESFAQVAVALQEAHDAWRRKAS